MQDTGQEAGPQRLRSIYQKFQAFTMVGEEKYIGNLAMAEMCKEIPGCVVECGTWRGGMIAGIADVLGADRRYYLFDSFEGLPPAQEIDGAAALRWQADTSSPVYYDNCRASEEEARAAMSLSAAVDYHLVKGWFRDTLPHAEFPEPITLLRLDADWYDSTKCILENLASKVHPGGLIIVDDYYTWDGCTRALNEFATLRNWRIRQFHPGGTCYIVA